MIVQMLRFRFRDEVSEQEKERALATIARTAALDSVAFSVIGQDLGDPADGYTHGYCVGIPDLAALERYLHAPTHRDGDFVFIPLLEKLARGSLSDDTDPALSEKIMAAFHRKVASDPEWAALFSLIPDKRIGRVNP